jgi:cytoskeletal protein CcmA (bactofilin family)
MFFKKRNRIQNAIATLIGADTSIEGDVNFSGGLRVDGTINGNICEPNASPSTLILSEDGRVEGDVTASQLELQAKAHIAGDVYYKSLEMHTGAVIEGKLVYLGENLQHQDASAI